MAEVIYSKAGADAAIQAAIGGVTGGTGVEYVTGNVSLLPADGLLRQVYATGPATVMGEGLQTGDVAAFRYLAGAWQVRVLDYDTEWRTVGVSTVTATAPTWTDDAIDGGGSWTTPVLTGVVYSPASGDASPGESVTVTATATAGYTLTGTTSWTHVFPGATLTGLPAVDTFAGAPDGSIVGRALETGNLTWFKGAGSLYMGADPDATAPTVTGGKLVSGTATVTSEYAREIVVDFDAIPSNNIPARIALGGGTGSPTILMQSSTVYIFIGGASAGSATAQPGTARWRFAVRDGAITVYRNDVVVITRPHASAVGSSWGVWPRNPVTRVEFKA